MKRIIFIATAFILLTACSEMLPQGEGAMQFNISYPGGTKVTTSGFQSGDAVSLFAVQWQGDTQYPLQVGGNFVNNAKLTCGGASWSAGEALYWGSQPCDFYALYPYQPTVSSVEKYPFSLAVDQNGDGFAKSDLLYAYAEKVSVNTPVTLNFKHMMSKLVVKLAKGEKFEGDIPDDAVAHVYNTIGSCNVDWTKGSVEKDAFGAKPTLTMKKLSNELFEAVIVPQNIEKRTPLIEVTMGGIAYLLEYSLSFRPGYVHTVTLTLNTSPDQEQIEITIDPDTNGWN